MQKFYFFVKLACLFCIVFPTFTQAQNCSALTATCVTYESRCAATGSIKVFATGGSGSYKYKTIGPVNSNFTTTDSITGLSAGTYTVVINDIITNCTYTRTNVVVTGSYKDPRFTLNKVDISCDHGNNGSITVTGQQFGRSPFAYSIVAPSPMGVGTTNNTGVFTGLIAGDYSIRMTDSCGGIQTRSITLNDYSWWIDSYVFNKTSCNYASGFIKVVDSRGNVSTVSGIAGFMYGVVLQPGDTTWSSNATFGFNAAGHSTFELVVKDNCGKIKKANVTLVFTTSIGASVIITGSPCSSFNAAVTNVTNFFNASYCLFDKDDVQVACNTTGAFSNLTYGNYCIKAYDSCLDTTIIRCFSVQHPAIGLNNTVTISDKNCNTFTAAVTGQFGLTNPGYCLYDSADVEIGCNTTGVFPNLAYGNYCIKTKDGCVDTTLIRCFNPTRPTPVIPDVMVPSYINCINFGLIVGGDSLTNPTYCLYDSSNVQISCNPIGIFDSIPLGNYCVTIHDACYDTTITRCLSVGLPVITNDVVAIISNQTCSTYTATVSSHNLINPEYCLYTTDSIQVLCNTTGVFENLPYASYCVIARNSCPDTSFTICFSALPPVPSVGSSVSISNRTCATFKATVQNPQNLTNPQYCIYDSNNVVRSCNTTGIFTSLPYGSYCIKIINTCYDTTLTVCFSAAPVPMQLSVSSSKSCSYGYARFNININGGTLPVNVQVYNYDGSLLNETSNSNSSFTIDSIPNSLTGEKYTVIATDKCGNVDSVKLSAVASYFTHIPTVVNKCPSATWLNGSGHIKTAVSTNMGSLTVRILKKNGVTLSPTLVPNSVAAGVYTFNDQAPATYILTYKANDGCGKTLYDTVVVKPYAYPNLNRSSAYQCDVSGFSIGAVANNGVSPFSYEIIGSTPSAPSIIAGPQTNPIFTIDNGNNYTLIRLRALDACGNATLGDASVLPLANNGIEASFNCFQHPTTLTVDTLYNSTYSWYKKPATESTDSTYMGGGSSLYIPEVLPTDTGVYICHIVVNTGCIRRSYYYHLDGRCYDILPVTIKEFTGHLTDDKTFLNWKTTAGIGLKHFVVERRNVDQTFIPIGQVAASQATAGTPAYSFPDNNPGPGANYYRLKMVDSNNRFSYSNTLVFTIKAMVSDIMIYPNPVMGIMNIDFGTSKNRFKVKVFNMLNQVVKEVSFNAATNSRLQLERTSVIKTGVYVIRLINLDTNVETAQKIVFR